MKTGTAIATMTAIFILGAVVPIVAQEAAQQVQSGESLNENIRLVLEVATPGLPTATYTITSNGKETRMDNMIMVVNSDGTKIPSKMSFEAHLMAIDDARYLVNYNYGLLFPVEISATSSDGVVSRNIEYSSLGTQSAVSMELGKRILLFSDPQRSVTLELQRVAPPNGN